MNAQNGPPPAATNELEVGAVLVDTLPSTLLTSDAPERYTVSAVFTRRPSRGEIDAIHDGATRDALTTAGYPTAELRVSDRRLEISNTNLEELGDGLASAIAERLHVISVKSAADHDRFAAELLEKTQRETDRAALVVLAAAAVSFVRPATRSDAEARWEGEGGSPDHSWFDVRNGGAAAR